MDLGLTGKKALVTGASYGIGKAIALELAREGCDVAICARDAAALEQTLAELKQFSSQNFLAFSCDVLKPPQIENTCRELLSAWNQIDILVNNVGGTITKKIEITESEDSDWYNVLERNAMAAIRFTRALLPSMQQANWGRVLCISSITGREAGGSSWYNMAKAAEISLMKNLSQKKEYVRKNITFNSVAPGKIIWESGAWGVLRKENPALYEQKQEELPLGRMGSVEEVANVVSFLCSDKASLVNGACIPVDGSEGKSF